MQERLEHIKATAERDIQSAVSAGALRELTARLVGRKRGEVTALFEELKRMPVEEKRQWGPRLNELKQHVERLLTERERALEQPTASLSPLEATWPGLPPTVGYLHPLTQFMREVEDIFQSMGFEVVTGPEVETPELNFDQLNIPADHPARDLWDTYYVNGGSLLRTHTSPVQLRAMRQRKPPVRLIATGRVFRREATDAGHETTFYQCEGLVIDRCISLANLIDTLHSFLKQVFGDAVKIRLRPEYYPFVEPGMDVDMQCLICGGQGCSVCKQHGWLEMLGSGMVHPTVLKNMGVDPKKYSGFAFGLGIDRLMMLKHGINDIRLSYGGDLRFLHQF